MVNRWVRRGFPWSVGWALVWDKSNVFRLSVGFDHSGEIPGYFYHPHDDHIFTTTLPDDPLARVSNGVRQRTDTVVTPHE